MSNTGDDTAGGSEEITSSKKECTSCEQNNVTEGINSVGMDDMSTCANCGKEGNSNDMNICNKCQLVKYCNAACKKKHRTKHKKKCDRRVAELYDEKLFKEVEPEECPLCFIPLPHTGRTIIESCCGKRICNGCDYAMAMSEGKDLCAFCRAPPPSSDEERVKQVKRLMDKGNGEGFYQLAGIYARGMLGLTQDDSKSNELLLKAGELGCAGGYYNLAQSFREGNGVERDGKNAIHYFELAAMGGDLSARHNLGCLEGEVGNKKRAYRHMIIAAKAGRKASLDYVKRGFMWGDVTKDEYANTLRAYHERQKEMKSDAREKATAASGLFGDNR